MPPLLEQILAIVEDWESANGYPLWPGDTLEKKRKFAAFCLDAGLLTPLVEPSGALAGFLFFYRGPYLDGIDMARPNDGGLYVKASVLWIRPDLRGTGALKELLKKAVREGREKILGAEKLAFGRRNGPDRIYNFPKFYRRFSGAK